MAYDLHVVRSADWTDTSSSPITKSDIDALVDGDLELDWSSADFVEMADQNGSVTRFYMIMWNGTPSFWWYRGQLLCSSPDDAQLTKLVRIASALNARVVGDDGEGYQLRKSLFGKEKIVRVDA
jgi:hypothetical protein